MKIQRIVLPYDMPYASPSGGVGGTLIFSYLRRLGSFFLLKISSFKIFWGFQKNEYFLGYEDLKNIFGAITKLDII